MAPIAVPKKKQKTAAKEVAEPPASGAYIIQFEDMAGEKLASQLDVPIDTTPEQLAMLVNELKNPEGAEGEATEYSFYLAEGEVNDKLSECITSKTSIENAIKVTYVPQSVFKARRINRNTSTLPGHEHSILSSHFSPNGKVLATGSGDNNVRLWDVSTELPKHTLKAHKDWVLAIAWSPCGRFLLSGGKEGMLALWSPAQNTPLRTLAAHKKHINAVAWEPLHANPESGRFASASKDNTVRIWDRVTGRCFGSLSGHTHSVTCLKWGGEGLIYTGSQDRTIKVWAVERCILVRTLEGHGHWVNCLSLSTEGAMRAGAYDHTGRAPADPAEARAVARKKYETARGQHGELLASGSDDFTLHLWSPTDSKKPITRMTGHVQLVNAVGFSPDGHWLASASFDGSIRLWNGHTGAFVKTFRGHVGAVYQLAWAADSRMLASGSKDSTIKVWEIKTKKLLEELPGHADEVYAVDWSPDGERVASGGKDKNLKIWRS